MKKLFSLLLALAMILMVGAAFATSANAYPITINNTNATHAHVYTAYQVFAGTLSEGDVLSNIQWGSGVNGETLLAELKTINAYKDCKNAQDVADVLEGFSDNSTQIEAFAEIVGKHLTTTGTVAAQGDDVKTYTANVEEPGYYIIKETGENQETARSASGFMISVVGPATMNVKDQPMTPDKNIEIQNGADPTQYQKVKENTANVGDDVHFIVDQIHVPSTDGYKTFKFVMKDTLPKGLTFKSLDSVKLGSTTLTLNTDYELKTTTSNTTGETEVRVVFKNALTLLKPYEGQVVEIKYTATVNKDANFGDSGNENEVVFEYTNNPDDDHTGDDFEPEDPHGTTPESTTKTYVTKIQILKVDEKGDALPGAVFSLSGDSKNVVVTTGDHFVEDANGTYYLLKDGTYTTTAPTGNVNTEMYQSTDTKYSKQPYTRTELSGADNVDITGVVSGSDGLAVFEGLKPGTYTITETGAPVGFNKINDPISFKIKFDSSTKKFAFDGTQPAGVTLEADGTFKITIENKQGSTLPSTGGIGTTIFYVLGGLLVVGAAVILVARRKAHE